MNTKKFHKILHTTPEEITEDIKLSMDILERIHELLDEKFDGKQKLLAQKLNKTEAEVSKWLNGVQNFTTKTLTKLSIAFGEPIIAVCTKKEETNSTFVLAKIPYKQSATFLAVHESGVIKESEFISYKSNLVKKNVTDNNLLLS